MPYLSFKKSDGCKPIAVVRGDASAVKGNKFVYVNEGQAPKETSLKLDYDEVCKLLKGYKTKEKVEIFEEMQKCALDAVPEDDVPFDEPKLKAVYAQALKDARNTFHAPAGCRFEYMPVVPDESKGATRECVFVTGCSGSGKSYWAKGYCENYSALYKGKNPIYLISSLAEDSTLDSAKCKIHRVSLDSLVDDPIDLNTGDMDNSLVIFDDWDTIENEKGKDGRKYADVLWKLLNDCLIMGRHNGITVLCISHYNTIGQKGRLILTECNSYVVYPHGTSAHALKYLLDHHVGIPKTEISKLNEYGRWIVLKKTYPKYLVSEHTVKLI
jgi:hypothetical protein